MALAGEGFDPNDDFAAKVLEGIKRDNDASRFNPGRPNGVVRVTTEEQQAKRDAVAEQNAATAELEADQLAVLEALTDSGQTQGTDQFEARFQDALAAAIEAKSSEVALAPPNPATATRADVLRFEERVRHDERTKLEAASKPAEDPLELDGNYFDGLGDDDTTETDDAMAEADDLYADDAEEDYSFSFDYSEPAAEVFE